MQGSREILISFCLSLTFFVGTYEVQKQLRAMARKSGPVSEPTRMSGTTDDPALALSWGLKDIHAPSAWKTSTGNKDIIVAVIDTGADYHHPDLKQSLWKNSGESGLDENGFSKETNGKDDDDNGFVDDVHGWNFVNHSPDVMDDQGHGTHIAGIIAAKKSNGIGSSGVAPDVSLMILKYYDPENSGPENLAFSVQAVRYAIRMGAKIINYSGGGILRSVDEEQILRQAAQQGILIVAAAGNEGLNSDFFHFYPADYDLPNILSVTALDRHGQLLHGSNFGKNTVDIGAPGKNIYSTLPGGEYGYMSGTSQATAYVSGAAALLMSSSITMNEPKKIIQKLLASGQDNRSLLGRTVSGKALDIESAIASHQNEVAQRESTQARHPAQEKKVF